MNERNKGFTIEAAIDIQDVHLAEWKLLLKKKIYEELYEAVKKSNPGVTDPYLITRGQDLSSWVANYGNSYKPF